jgi:hypothetical protein
LTEDEVQKTSKSLEEWHLTFASSFIVASTLMQVTSQQQTTSSYLATRRSAAEEELDKGLVHTSRSDLRLREFSTQKMNDSRWAEKLHMSLHLADSCSTRVHAIND